MKKMQKWGLITVTVLIFIAIAIGVIGHKIGEKPKNDLLTLKTIVKTFEKQGVPLKKDKSKSPHDFELSGVKPAIFSVDKEKGTLKLESYKEESPEIQYKMDDRAAVGSYEFEYKTTSGSGGATGTGVNQDGYLTLGHGGGSGAIPSEDEEIPFTIKWNGKEENIILKAQ